MGTPQQARSHVTRQRLLDATVQCLYELGYANTTTTEVCRRAGVSRGAQLHHFPTKAELVVAAVDHLFALRVHEYNERLSALPPDVDRRGPAIDILWEMYRGPTFYAWLELLVAARTDDELRPHVHEMSRRFVDDAEATFRAMFPGDNPHPMLGELAPMFVLCLLDGLAVGRIAFGDDPRGQQLIDMLKRLAFISDRVSGADGGDR